MDETLLLVLIIASFLALTIFSLAAMLVMYRREKDRQEARNLEKIIAEFDEALNTALNEINKLGAVAQGDLSEKIKEMEEKYRSVLFLYNLIDEKQKEFNDLAASPAAVFVAPAEEAVSVPDITPVTMHEMIHEDDSADATEVFEPVVAVVRSPSFQNPKHKKIWEMWEHGLSVPEIAKSLGLGQGEVKLILNLANLV